MKDYCTKRIKPNDYSLGNNIGAEGFHLRPSSLIKQSDKCAIKSIQDMVFISGMFGEERVDDFNAIIDQEAHSLIVLLCGSTNGVFFFCYTW